MSSQKHWDDELDLVSESNSMDEEVMFTKYECAEMFREEVREWINNFGPKLLRAEPTAVPHITQKTAKKKAKLSSSAGGKKKGE